MFGCISDCDGHVYALSFTKLSLTKNPKKRPPAERLLFHPFVLAGDLSQRYSMELLQKVRNPEATTPIFDEPDEDGIVHNVPRRISSKAPKGKAAKSQAESNLGKCLMPIKYLKAMMKLMKD